MKSGVLLLLIVVMLAGCGDNEEEYTKELIIGTWGCINSERIQPVGLYEDNTFVTFGFFAEGIAADKGTYLYEDGKLSFISDETYEKHEYNIRFEDANTIIWTTASGDEVKYMRYIPD